MLRLSKITQHAKNLRLRQGGTPFRPNSTLDAPPPIQRSFSTLQSVNMHIEALESYQYLHGNVHISQDSSAAKQNYLKLQKLLEYSLEVGQQQSKNSTNSALTTLSRFFKPKEKETKRLPTQSQDLYHRQIALEERQRTRAELEHREIVSNLKMIGRGTSIKNIQRNILSWYEPLTKQLVKERQLVLTGVKSEDRLVSPLCLFYNSTFFILKKLDSSIELWSLFCAYPRGKNDRDRVRYHCCRGPSKWQFRYHFPPHDAAFGFNSRNRSEN